MRAVTIPTVYELSVPGRRGVDLPEPDVPSAELPAAELREDCALPELSQLEVVRHYRALSERNFGIDTGFYPLGSCTMKYNPKVNEEIARLSAFAESHPLAEPDTVQGNLALIFELQRWLAEIGGLSAVTLQPAAGAQGEFTGLLMIRAYHRERGDAKRTRILIPDSAHGTNPASTTMAGYTAVELASDRRGNIDLDAVRAVCDDTVAGIMMTNPNTLGLFEERLEEVVRLVHACGGLVYGDGANLNAIAGIVRPGDLGFDVMHYNLHKTFATPHGGGGPGSGPVGVTRKLVKFLPTPHIRKRGRRFELRSDRPDTIGPVMAYAGNVAVILRAFAYMRMLGADGIRRVAQHAVLNARYLCAKIKGPYKLAYEQPCMHEFVMAGLAQASGVRTLDVAKRLIELGLHPPTIYFPLIVHEALMVEPTETESKQTLDSAAAKLLQIAEEARTNPQLVTGAPRTTPVGRLDEVRAARTPDLAWKPGP
jgi:glycine dehydrogenase subunit 2